MCERERERERAISSGMLCSCREIQNWRLLMDRIAAPKSEMIRGAISDRVTSDCFHRFHRFTASANRRFDRQAMREFLSRNHDGEPKVSCDNPESGKPKSLAIGTRDVRVHDRPGRDTRDFSAINASPTLSALLNRDAESHAGCCRSKASGLASESRIEGIAGTFCRRSYRCRNLYRHGYTSIFYSSYRNYRHCQAGIKVFT